MRFPAISLKLKIILLFFALSSLLCSAMVVLWYRTLEAALFEELQNRLRNIAYLSARTLDRPALVRLNRRLRPGLGATAALEVMATPDYRLVAGQLAKIVDLERDLLLYAYVLKPDPDDENFALVLADNGAASEAADARELLLAAVNKGEAAVEFSGERFELPAGLRQDTPAFAELYERVLAVEGVWRFGYRANIADFPVMIRAMRERANLVEDELYYDAEGDRVGEEIVGIWSFSGYEPVRDQDGRFLGLLGVDISANKMKAVLAVRTRRSIYAGAAAMAVSLLVSLLLGWFISRRIMLLNRVVQEFGRRRLDVRADIHSRDEVEELANSFNDMADQIQSYSQNLEDMVRDRTHELNEANRRLTEVHGQLLRELTVARRVQENILPRSGSIEAESGLRIAARYRAMETLGGDLYDFFKVGAYEFGFMISDVSGHGVASALITSLAKVSFQTHSRASTPPAAVCARVNDDLYRMIGDMQHYLTAQYMLLDVATGRLRFTSAGHPPALFHRARTGECLELETAGVMIGVLADESFQEESLDLEAGDKILLYTDGITEAWRGNEIFGMERLHRFFLSNAAVEPEEILERLERELENFSGPADARDDRAAICIEYRGRPDG